MAEHSYLSVSELRARELLRQADSLWCNCEPDLMLSVLDRLEEALKENESLRRSITNFVDLSWLEDEEA